MTDDGATPTTPTRQPDPRVEIPEGHERGEELTLPQRALYRAIWLLMQSIARTYFRLRTKDLAQGAGHRARSSWRPSTGRTSTRR